MTDSVTSEEKVSTLRNEVAELKVENRELEKFLLQADIDVSKHEDEEELKEIEKELAEAA